MNDPINPPPPPAVDRIRQKVIPPAIGLIVTGGLGVLVQILSRLLGLAGNFMQGFREDLPEGMDSPEFIVPLLDGVFSIVSSVIGLVIAAVIIYAGIRMLKLEAWGLAVAASILAMIPCVSPCCIIGLPVGIWALVVLIGDDVKMVFK